MYNTCRCGVIAVGLIAAGVSCRTNGLSLFPYVSPPAGHRLPGAGSLGATVSRALEAEYRGQIERDPPPPIALVPTDGSELELTRLAANVTIRGPLAHSELTLAFRNHEQRRREGRFTIDLPTGAALGGFSMKVHGEWRHARIVAREQGREVYESFLKRRVDPALLEQDLGNRFSVRIFPIDPGEVKELIIKYDHLVSAHRPYVLPLSGLPAIGELDIAIDNDGELTTKRERGDRGRDLTVEVGGGDLALVDGESFVARIDQPIGTANPDLGRSLAAERLLVLVDTSASRAPVMGRQVELVRSLIAALPSSTAIEIAAFDHAVTTLYRGTADGAGAVLVTRLYDHGALGASDLARALAYAGGSDATRLVLIGDGVSTLGERDANRIVERVAGTRIARIDAVQLGSSFERDVVARLVAAGRKPGAILDASDGGSRIAIQLAAELPAAQPVLVAGATFAWPTTTRGLAPGQPLYVSGRRTRNDGPLEVRIGDRVVHVAPRGRGSLEVARAVARAELADLTEQLTHADGSRSKLLEAAIEKIALAHQLVSVRTSLLVLESDADELSTLGPRPGQANSGDLALELAMGITGESRGETIAITSRAPTVDVGSTATGITIEESYTRNIPTGRTFADTLVGSVAGAQHDGYGVSFSGSTSAENVYIVDGVNTTAIGPAGRRAARHTQIAPHSSMLPFPTYGGTTDFEPPRKSFDIGRSPYEGVTERVMAALRAGQRDDALALATARQVAAPGDLAAIIALGEAAEASGAAGVAARVYGSIADLYPNRAELLRAAGERIARTGAHELALDLYRRALAERKDHVTTYRLVAWELVRTGALDDALATLVEGERNGASLQRAALMTDTRIVAAMIIARDPGRRGELARFDPVPAVPLLHIVLSWETDANDVDLHVWDRNGDHGYFEHPTLASGGKLAFDVTTGFGPESFAIDKPDGFPYRIAAHYYSRGPMGLGLGTVQVIRFDGRDATVEDRPFMLQRDDATIDLGVIR